ncbi:MAG: hypothetical protein ACP5N1_04710 [Candidatus Woesearchaeota archaeon]
MKNVYKKMKQVMKLCFLPVIVAGSVAVTSCGKKLESTDSLLLKDFLHYPINSNYSQSSQQDTSEIRNVYLDSIVECQIKNLDSLFFVSTKDSMIDLMESKLLIEKYRDLRNIDEKIDSCNLNISIYVKTNEIFSNEINEFYKKLEQNLVGFDLFEPQVKKYTKNLGLDIEKRRTGKESLIFAGIFGLFAAYHFLVKPYTSPRWSKTGLSMGLTFLAPFWGGALMMVAFSAYQKEPFNSIDMQKTGLENSIINSSYIYVNMDSIEKVYEFKLDSLYKSKLDSLENIHQLQLDSVKREYIKKLNHLEHRY